MVVVYFCFCANFDSENVFPLDFAVVGALLSLHLALFTIDQILSRSHFSLFNETMFWR